ncbi:uncharacterized protein F5891DRAFT_1150793 [Suillus fuscotomentosus]|uniref:Uncharacterized protein n=1 Tax=Suillus fuscotomentosus TaxID=1912939 RepID=A0AAD4DY73_9AGAM|nr:uncharacterized protein F5891DRAFT_1150793 [Suillus fuscotomentosus]KAG1896275.1 hypothetical protein F5891DRAFT_1150793 [Suillus fuscotomentosus]
MAKRPRIDSIAKRRQDHINKNPPTTPAYSAVARSSCPPSCKQSSEKQGRQKFDNQRMRAVPS